MTAAEVGCGEPAVVVMGAGGVGFGPCTTMGEVVLARMGLCVGRVTEAMATSASRDS